MGAEAANELRNSTFEERCGWILDKKEEGNVEYKQANYKEAIDKYLASLCGFDFKKTLSAEKKNEVDKTLKVPVLNNLAKCLMKQKKYQRAMDMLDQALKVDKVDEKALLRKAECFIELGNHDRANGIFNDLDMIAEKRETFTNKEMNKLKTKMKKTSKGEKEFAKALFSAKESLYDEKKNAKTKEEEAAEEEEMRKQAAIEQKQ